MSASEQWLYGRRRVVLDWHADGPPGAAEESLERALAGIDALHAAGVLTPDEVSAWRDRFATEPSAGRARPSVAPEAAADAARVLEELLAAVPAEDAPDEASYERFEGALELLAAVGAVDVTAWDSRLRARTGQPTREEEQAQTRALKAGGTEVELVGVRAGPTERRAGYRVVVALIFADGVSMLIDKDPARTPDIDWPDWRLTDDAGTRYPPGGAGGSDTDEHISFRTGPPAGAHWLDLQLDGHPDVTFRIAL
jgi:hypothetical protein